MIRLKLAGKMDDCDTPSETSDHQNVSPKSVTDFSEREVLPMDQSIVVYVSAGSEEEALTIARTLVGERLAACVNLFSKIRSIYRWEGKVCDEPECYLIIKTRRDLFHAVRESVRRLHSYEVPEIIALPIVDGIESYLEWIHKETKEA